MHEEKITPITYRHLKNGIDALDASGLDQCVMAVTVAGPGKIFAFPVTHMVIIEKDEDSPFETDQLCLAFDDRITEQFSKLSLLRVLLARPALMSLAALFLYLIALVVVAYVAAANKDALSGCLTIMLLALVIKGYRDYRIDVAEERASKDKDPH